MAVTLYMVILKKFDLCQVKDFFKEKIISKLYLLLKIRWKQNVVTSPTMYLAFDHCTFVDLYLNEHFYINYLRYLRGRSVER